MKNGAAERAYVPFGEGFRAEQLEGFLHLYGGDDGGGEYAGGSLASRDVPAHDIRAGEAQA